MLVLAAESSANFATVSLLSFKGVEVSFSSTGLSAVSSGSVLPNSCSPVGSASAWEAASTAASSNSTSSGAATSSVFSPLSISACFWAITL